MLFRKWEVRDLQDNDVLLKVTDVYKQFPVKKRMLHAVSGVDLSLSRGESLGLVGESGCGKSTLAKMIAGSLLPTSGTIALEGVDYYRLVPREFARFRRNIQMVFQDPLSSFSPRMRIGAYLCEPRINYDHVSKKDAMKEALGLLEKVGLPTEFADRFPHELSGGQLQRVAIARAIAINPKLLICDEATGALDVSIQNQIAKLLVSIIEEWDMGCLFIGHDLALVRSVTQRTAIMYMGRIVEVLDSETLGEEYGHPYTKALLESIFDVYCDQDEPINVLPGEPPSPMEEHTGCPFASRCPNCTEQCRVQMPALRPVNGRHKLACFNPIG